MLDAARVEIPPPPSAASLIALSNVAEVMPAETKHFMRYLVL